MAKVLDELNPPKNQQIQTLLVITISILKVPGIWHNTQRLHDNARQTGQDIHTNKI